jgi:hypothetical protein
MLERFRTIPLSVRRYVILPLLVAVAVFIMVMAGRVAWTFTGAHPEIAAAIICGIVSSLALWFLYRRIDWKKYRRNIFWLAMIVLVMYGIIWTARKVIACLGQEVWGGITIMQIIAYTLLILSPICAITFMWRAYRKKYPRATGAGTTAPAKKPLYVRAWTKVKPWFTGSFSMFAFGMFVLLVAYILLYVNVLPGHDVFTEVFWPHRYAFLWFCGALLAADILRTHKGFSNILAIVITAAAMFNLIVVIMIWQSIVMVKWGDQVRQFAAIQADTRAPRVDTPKIRMVAVRDIPKVSPPHHAHHTPVVTPPPATPSVRQNGVATNIVVKNDNVWSKPIDMTDTPYELTVTDCVDELVNGRTLHHVCPNDGNMNVGLVYTLQFQQNSEIDVTVTLTRYPKQ